MSMTEQFFSVEYNNRGDLFEGLSIWENERFRQLQGTYPVIFLSFADIKETSCGQMRKKLCRIIKAVYNQYDFLLKSDALNECEKKEFQNISVAMETNEISYSLKALANYLYRYYGKKVIILLDEYDTPMQEESPSNKSPRLLYSTEKNCSVILIFNVLPNLLGRAIKVTGSSASHHSRIKSVLST